MSFAFPAALAGLILVPLAVVAYVLAQRRREQYAARFTNLALLAEVAPKRPGPRRHLPMAAYLLAVAALVLALARPEANLPVEREEASAVLVTDVSGSMEAVDVAPTRLGAAQDAARRFVETAGEKAKIGIVTFSTQVRTAVPPTEERDLVTSAIDALQARGGTAMGDAIDRALDDLEAVDAIEEDAEDLSESDAAEDTQPPAALLLLSDGENNAGLLEPLAAADRARDLGVPIHAVALGTDEGQVEVPDAFGTPRTIDVPPDRETLREIADRTGGEYFDAPSDEELRSVYEQLGSRLTTETETRELTAAFAGLALLLVLAGAALSLAWFNRFP